MNGNLRPFMLAAAIMAAALSLGACDSKPTANSGEALFKKKCSTCHSFVPGEHKVGPSLAGVMGRKAGSTGFAKYRALKDADFTWNPDSIAEWITDPKKYMGKPTAMTVKIKNEKDRQAIIKYLTGKDH